jgi:hypothetical protein
MSSIGINLEKNGFRYTVLNGDKKKPILIDKRKVSINANSSISELMDWYESSFENLLNKHQPANIGIKLSLNAKKAEIAYWYYPYGVLHNMAFKKGISITEYVPPNFTPSKFNLDKKVNVYDHIDTLIGVHPPNWDKSQKYSVLAAWILL